MPEQAAGRPLQASAALLHVQPVCAEQADALVLSLHGFAVAMQLPRWAGSKCSQAELHMRWMKIRWRNNT